jgi:hypothetical protein
MKRFSYALLAALTAVLALAAGGCGGGSDDPTKVDVKVTENSNTDYSISIPSEIEGGAVELTLDNSGNQEPHAAQLIQLGEGHTYAQAQAIIESEKPQEVPDWIHGYGGIGTTQPGQTGTATVFLDEGHYVLQDNAENDRNEPVVKEFDVEGTNDADLPDEGGSITAATTGSDDPAHEYEWKTADLKAGENTITWDSQGEEALHLLAAFPIKDGATIDDVKKEFASDFGGGQPRTIDPENAVDLAVLDGGKKEVTTVNLQPGRYAFVCFLPDRDEPDKPHTQTGLFSEVTVPSS